MIFLIAGIAVVVLGIAAWARIGAGRSDRLSVQSYEHARGVLGDVAKRGEAAAPVRLPDPTELARPHVRPSSPFEQPRPQPGPEVVPPPRIRLTPPEPIEPPVEVTAPVAATPPEPIAPEPGAGEDHEVVVTFDDTVAAPEVRPLSSRAGRQLAAPRGGALRRATTGAAAAVVLGTLGVVGYQLATHHNSPPGLQGAPSPTTASGGSHSTATTQPQSPRQTPTSLQPTSSSPTVVAYDVPASSYTVQFTSTGRCWIGVQRQVAGPYLWMTTIPPSSSTSYAASGSILVYIGAPANISIEVDGIPVTLPADNVQPYRIALTPAVQASA